MFVSGSLVTLDLEFIFIAVFIFLSYSVWIHKALLEQS